MDASKYTLKLKGQRVLIVGGSSGLGFAAAEASIENGASVLISSSSQQKVDKAVERLQQAYPSAKDRVSGYACNLSDQAGLEKNVVDLLEKAGTLDHISKIQAIVVSSSANSRQFTLLVILSVSSP